MPCGVQADIDSAVAVHLERAKRADCELLDGLSHAATGEASASAADTVLTLVGRAPLHPRGSDAVQRVRHRGELHLPDRERARVLVPDDPHIQFTPLNVLLHDGVCAESVVDIGHPFTELGIVGHDRRL